MNKKAKKKEMKTQQQQTRAMTNQKESTQPKQRKPGKKITKVKVELRGGGTLNLMDGNAVKQWITKNMMETPGSMYDCVHIILDKQRDRSKVKEMYKKYIDSKKTNRPDAIKALAEIISKAYVMNH